MLRNCAVGWGGVGWGGDDDILWTWTHGGCYATVLVLSLHTWWMLRNCAVGWGGVGWGWWHSLNLNTWWMLRNCACLIIAHIVDATQLCGGVGWGGVGMMTFFELEHMVDATQLCLSYHCTHGGCYATVRWGGVGWGGDDDILWTWTHGGCYATVLVLSLHTWWMLRNCAVGWGGVGWGWWHSLNLNTWWMLRNCACLIIAHMVDATQLCLSYHCTHGGCYATVRWGGVGWGGDDDILWTWTHGGCYATVLVLSLHTYGNCMMQSARGQQPGTLFRVYRGWNTSQFCGYKDPHETTGISWKVSEDFCRGSHDFKKIIFQLESRWSATPISLGLSWSLTKKPPFGSVVVPSTFTTVYIDIYIIISTGTGLCNTTTLLGGGFIFFNFHPYLGKLPNLTNIFQLGWNHQPILPCMSELTSISCCTMSQLGCFRKVPHPFGRSFAEENPRKLWAHFRRKQNPWRWLPCFTYGGPVVSWSSTTCTPAPPPSTKTAIPEGSWGEGRVSKFKQDFRGNKKCIGGRELV